jgi:tRNA dimethylallyltransferase
MSESRRPAVGAVVAVVGPTGVGKTAVAEELAVRWGGEIVSADSMQVYRGMDIGTAKPPIAVRRVPYHCLDLMDPGAPYSAALYQLDARDAIDGIVERGSVPVLAGGTGLYVRAALDDWVFPPGEAATPVREHLESLAADIGPDALHARLAETDPASAALIHPNNVRRTIRALEMAADGVSYAAQHAGYADRCSAYPTILIGVEMERAALYERIEQRVDDMIASGLIDEVTRLLSDGYRDALTSAQAIGYKEIVAAFDGHSELDHAIAGIKQASRRYAKRQLTWFRADRRVRWVDVTATDTHRAADLAQRLVESAELA